MKKYLFYTIKNTFSISCIPFQNAIAVLKSFVRLLYLLSVSYHLCFQWNGIEWKYIVSLPYGHWPFKRCIMMLSLQYIKRVDTFLNWTISINKPKALKIALEKLLLKVNFESEYGTDSTTPITRQSISCNSSKTNCLLEKRR